MQNTYIYGIFVDTFVCVQSGIDSKQIHTPIS